MTDWAEALKELIAPEHLLFGESLSNHTTMRVGGPADAMVFPASAAELRLARELAVSLGIPCLLMGKGSNLIVRDGGLRGLAIVLGDRFSAVRTEGEVLIAQAGASLAQLAKAALDASLTGLEFASGIPGTVGGGVAMNAGAYGGEIKDLCEGASLLTANGEEQWTAADFAFGYRDSRALREGATVTEARFRLRPGSKEQIAEKMRELNARRRDKQPLNLPSAGSVFKRPAGHFAGALIEAAQLKGLRVGGAEVSEKHAGFIVNRGGATARDVIDLIKLVQKRVLEHSGVSLECEVRIVGED